MTAYDWKRTRLHEIQLRIRIAEDLLESWKAERDQLAALEGDALIFRFSYEYEQNAKYLEVMRAAMIRTKPRWPQQNETQTKPRGTEGNSSRP